MVESHRGLLEISFPRRQPSLKTLASSGESSAAGPDLGSDSRHPLPVLGSCPFGEGTTRGLGDIWSKWGNQKHPQARVIQSPAGQPRKSPPGEISFNTMQIEAHQSVGKGPGQGGWFSHRLEGLVQTHALVSCINLVFIHRLTLPRGLR